jgi:hypothetical protein
MQKNFADGMIDRYIENMTDRDSKYPIVDINFD